MAIIPILQYPNPRLKTKAERVTDFGSELQKIVDDMLETHYSTENCAALAATQLDFKNPKHITVIDFSPDKDQPLVLINAEIIHSEGETNEPEGCMSIGGGVYERVKRAATIRVKAYNRLGEGIEFEADGFLAKCIQHELDHLNGVIILDRLSRLKRQMAEKRVAKWHQTRMA